MQLLTLCLSGPQPRVAVQVFSVADQVFLKTPGFAIPAKAGNQDSWDCGKRRWPHCENRLFEGATVTGVGRAFCFFRASQRGAAAQVFSKKPGFVIPAQAGIQ